MAIKFYSDVTGESYESRDAAVKAEEAVNKKIEEENKKKEEQKKRFEEIEDAKKKVRDLIQKYIEDYGNYSSIKESNNCTYDIFDYNCTYDIFDFLKKLFE